MVQPKVTVNGVQNIRREKSVGEQIWDVTQVIGALLLFIAHSLFCMGVAIYRKFQPVEPKSVRGEIVLITGTGHGIGKELAYLYASEGATVVGWDINQQLGDATVKEMEALGFPKAYSYVCDVSKREDVLAVAERVRKDIGEVTILVNNAGIMPTHPLLDHTPEEIERIMGINIMAHFWTLEAFLPSMMKNNNGHIVCLSSLAGHLGCPNLVPYCASKYAARGLMEALHEELRYLNPKNRIQLTTICPYMVDTGLCKRPKIRFESMMPILNPKDVASKIMNAQRTNLQELCIPEYIGTMNNLHKLLPKKPSERLKDFLEAVVESDL